MSRSLCRFIVLLTLENFKTDGEPTVIVGGKKYNREQLQKKIKVSCIDSLAPAGLCSYCHLRTISDKFTECLHVSLLGGVV